MYGAAIRSFISHPRSPDLTSSNPTKSPQRLSADAARASRQNLDSRPKLTARARRMFSSVLFLMAAGCASAPLDRAGSLASYDDLAPANGLLAHSLLRVSKVQVLAAKTVRVTPTVFAETAGDAALSLQQRRIVANAIDRSLCTGLSDRFQVVPLGQPADLTVHAVVTHLAPTNAAAAGVSKVVSIAPSIAAPGLHVLVPRIPIGLGSLSLEAEARDRNDIQAAAMIWARGANSFTSSPRVSSDGDAYDLAAAFGDDFSKLLVTGASPFGTMPTLPSVQMIGASLGSSPKNAACEAFGRGPGLVGLIGGGIGLPPDWTDKGAPPNASAPGSVAALPAN
jgi:hypothetical protein